MPDEPWVHVYVCSAETAYQVLDPTEARATRKAPKPRVSIRAAYAIALKILIILSRLL